jgi:hypothetical protein
LASPVSLAAWSYRDCSCGSALWNGLNNADDRNNEGPSVQIGCCPKMVMNAGYFGAKASEKYWLALARSVSCTVTPTFFHCWTSACATRFMDW